MSNANQETKMQKEAGKFWIEMPDSETVVIRNRGCASQRYSDDVETYTIGKCNQNKAVQIFNSCDAMTTKEVREAFQSICKNSYWRLY